MIGAFAFTLLLGALPAAPPDVYAIHVGVNLPPEGSALRPLSYADDDAVRFHLFTRPFARRSWLLTVADAPTQRRHTNLGRALLAPRTSELSRVVRELKAAIARSRAAGREVWVWFSYSGHGVVDEGGTGLALLDGRLGAGFLRESLAELDADAVHLFIDACHAEGLVEGRGLSERSVAGRELASDEAEVFEQGFFERYPHVGALLASAADQQTHEWSRLQAGVFTHEVLSGLAGPADVNGDGQVAYSELAAFVASANRDLADPRAAPQIKTRPPQLRPGAALVDTGWLTDWARLERPPASWGHFWVERADGLRLLDAHVDDSLSMRAVVPAGAQLFIRHALGEVVVTPKRREVLQLEQLVVGAPTTAPRGSVARALHEGLFRSPYSKPYYDGYVDSQALLPVRTAPSAPSAERSPATEPAPTGEGFDDLYERTPDAEARVAADRTPPHAAAATDGAADLASSGGREAHDDDDALYEEATDEGVALSGGASATSGDEGSWLVYSVGLGAAAAAALVIAAAAAGGMGLSYLAYEATDYQAPAANAATVFYLCQAGVVVAGGAAVALAGSAGVTGVLWALE